MTEQEMKQTLHDIMSLGIAHIEVVRKELRDLKLAEEDKEGSERYLKARLMLIAAGAMVDVIHPAFESAKSLFEDKRIHSFLDEYKHLHTNSPARLHSKVECPCISCKGSDADTSSSSDQTQQV